MLKVGDTRRPQPPCFDCAQLVEKHTDHFNGHFPGEFELAGLHIYFSSSWTVQISINKFIRSKNRTKKPMARGTDNICSKYIKKTY